MRRIRLVVVLALVAALGALGTARSTDRTVLLRQKFFGVDNVDPDTGAVRADRVILSWTGVTNFAAAFNGHVVLLDAWVPRGEYSGYVPTNPNELAELRPEYVILGHAHFDHAADAAEIISKSGATLVGAPEHCLQVRKQAAPATVTCVDALPTGSLPGATGHLDTLIPGMKITIVKHIHSAAEPPDPSDPHGPALAMVDQGMLVQHLPAPQDTQHLVTHLGDGENGTLLYKFEIGDFQLLWHDSSGPLAQLDPALLRQLQTLRPVDVELGAIMGFNQITNGLRDPRTYTEAFQPRIFVPTHDDNWAPGLTTRAENYEPLIREEYAKIAREHQPRFSFLYDPADYVRPGVLTFDPAAAYWRS